MFGKKIKTGYESDATRMIRELLAAKPEIADEQKTGRALWWDRQARPRPLAARAGIERRAEGLRLSDR